MESGTASKNQFRNCQIKPTINSYTGDSEGYTVILWPFKGTKTFRCFRQESRNVKSAAFIGKKTI